MNKGTILEDSSIINFNEKLFILFSLKKCLGAAKKNGDRTVILRLRGTLGHSPVASLYTLSSLYI